MYSYKMSNTHNIQVKALLSCELDGVVCQIPEILLLVALLSNFTYFR